MSVISTIRQSSNHIGIYPSARPEAPGSMDQGALERVADRLILEQAGDNDMHEFLEALPTGRLFKHYKLLLLQNASILAGHSPLELSASESYFASRLVARGMFLNCSLEDCMYALADAVKTASVIDIFRWRSVLIQMNISSRPNKVALRLADQTARVFRSLLALTDSKAVGQEQIILRILSTRAFYG